MTTLDRPLPFLWDVSSVWWKEVKDQVMVISPSFLNDIPRLVQNTPKRQQNKEEKWNSYNETFMGVITRLNLQSLVINVQV